MGKLGFLAGMAAGYVLVPVRASSTMPRSRPSPARVWNSQPVQKQVASAKAARTKAAPVVADLVGDAAKATAARLRAQRTVASETISSTAATPTPEDRCVVDTPAGDDPWAAASRP